MAYWIQEPRTTQNNPKYRSYMCDFRTDIDKLPKQGIEGEIQVDDSTASIPCSYGSDCLCLEDSSVWILGKETNEWKEI